MVTNNEIQRLYKELEKVSVDEIYVDGNCLCVSIHWGDWKHDHGRCDWILNRLGYGFIGCEVTEEDGSDTYSGIRRYYPREEREFNGL